MLKVIHLNSNILFQEIDIREVDADPGWLRHALTTEKRTRLRKSGAKPPTPFFLFAKVIGGVSIETSYIKVFLIARL